MKSRWAIPLFERVDRGLELNVRGQEQDPDPAPDLRRRS